MDKKERSTTSSSSTSFSQPTDMATSPQPAQGAHTHTTSHTWKRILSHPRRGDMNLHCHPALNGMPRLTPCSHTRCTTSTGKGESGCALPPSSLLHMTTEEDSRRHTQLQACTTKEVFKSTAMCILCACVVVCACRNTKQNIRKKGAEYAERRTKMYSGGAWRKQQLEDRSNS
ncbi:hypothetical protein TcCL_NonESM06961 [Trypanosoma cruzi]|nr:hypothetical protein TcCL_NonESM06961 [Trypanosoma cruzi]